MARSLVGLSQDVGQTRQKSLNCLLGPKFSLHRVQPAMISVAEIFRGAEEGGGGTLPTKHEAQAGYRACATIQRTRILRPILIVLGAA